MTLYLRLFWEFFKTGLFAVGGGMATLPFLSDMAEKTGWFTHQQLTDMIAVSESTPGPIGINCATYVGYVTAGPTGGIIATLGIITPSIIIILFIAAALKNFKDNHYVQTVFRFLRPTSVALICSAGFSVVQTALFTEWKAPFYTFISWKAWAIAAAVFVLSRCIKKTKGLHPIIWIGLSALAGILLF
jgi:chromate transporter